MRAKNAKTKRGNKEKIISRSLNISQSTKISLLAILILSLGFGFLMIRGTFYDTSLSQNINTTVSASRNKTSLTSKAILSPLGLSAALAAGGKTINFFWTPNERTQFYRLYHGIKPVVSGVPQDFGESYDSQNYATSL